jgi:hypothetical protein
VLHYRAHPLPPMPGRPMFPVSATSTGQVATEPDGGGEMEIDENNVEMEAEDGVVVCVEEQGEGGAMREVVIGS